MVFTFLVADYDDFGKLMQAVLEASEMYYPTEKRPLALYVSYKHPMDPKYHREVINSFDIESIAGLFQGLEDPSRVWNQKNIIGSDVASRIFNSVAKRDMETNELIIEKLIEVEKMVLFQFGENLSEVEEPLRGILEAYNPPPVHSRSMHEHGFFRFCLNELAMDEINQLTSAAEKPRDFFKHKPRGFVGACWIAKNLTKACKLFQLPFFTTCYGDRPLFDERHENQPQWYWSEKRLELWDANKPLRRVRAVPCHVWSLQKCLEKIGHPQQKQIIGIYKKGELGGKVTVATKSFVDFLAGYGCRVKIYKISETSKGPLLTSNISKKVCENECLLEFDRFQDHLMMHYTPTVEEDGWLFEKNLVKKFSVLQGLRYMLDQKIIKPMNGYEIYKRVDFSAGFDQQCDFFFEHFLKQANPMVVPRDYQRIAYSKGERDVLPYIGFFDFEASTDEEHHKPYCVSYCIEQSIEKYKDGNFKINNIWGDDLDCARQLLRQIGNYWCTHGKIIRKQGIFEFPSIVMYAHNLAYDCTFLKPFLTGRKIIEQGGRVYRMEGTYTFFINKEMYSIKIIFQDTLCLFQTSLRNVGKDYIWGEEAKSIKKEVFPYDWYTFENFNRYPNNWAPITEIQESFNDPTKYEEFLTNIRSFGPSIYNEDSSCFNYKKYAAFYCDQDVRVLARAFYNLRQLYLGNQTQGSTIHGTLPFSIDILTKITASGIAFDWFIDTVIAKHNLPISESLEPSEEEVEEITRNLHLQHPRMVMGLPKLIAKDKAALYAERMAEHAEDFIYKCNGPLRTTILQANRGGRCMVADNGKFYYSAAKNNGVKLQDYDAVSLYPSAMRRLWVSTGQIKLFNPGKTFNQEDFKEKWLRSEIFENPGGKWTDAVLHVTKLNSVRKLHFPVLCLRNPEDKLNEWRNFDNETVDTWVNAIDLENFIDFQQGEFEWDYAIFWDQERSTLIQEQIQALFDFRKANKEKDNYHPIEKVTKTMMNSISGKSITKIHKTETRYLNYNKYDKCFYYPKWIAENAYRVKSLEICAGNEIKAKIYSRDFGYALPIFGQDVFAMARKIIQPIFNIAEDLELEHPEMAPSVFYTDTDSLHIREDMLVLVEERYKQLYHKNLKGKELGEFHIDFDPVAGHQVLGAVECYFCAKKIYVDKLLLDNGEFAYHKRMKGIPNDLIDWSHYEKIFNGGIQPYQLVDPNHPSFIFEEGVIKSRRFMERRIMLKEAREKLIQEAALLTDFGKALKKAAKEDHDDVPAKHQKI